MSSTRGTAWTKVTEYSRWYRRQGSNSEFVTTPMPGNPEVLYVMNGYRGGVDRRWNDIVSAHQAIVAHTLYSKLSFAHPYLLLLYSCCCAVQWVSTDNAVTFERLNPAATYDGRMDSQLSVTSNGIMVVSGGDCGNFCNKNDV